MVTPQEPKPTGVEKTAVIVPKRAELVTQKFQTPETKTAEARISQPTYDTLLEAITFNIDIANQMSSLTSTSFLGKFIETFKTQYSGIDLKNPDQVREKADEFLKNGEGRAVLLSLKLLEMQGALLSAGSGAYFKELKKATPGKEPKVKKIYKTGKDGLTIVSEPETVQKKFLFFSWQERQTTSPPTAGENILEMNDNFSYGTQITDPQEIEYLQKCGFVDGLDLKNDPQAQEALSSRLDKIALARYELFLETGKSFTQVDLNFVDSAGNYLTTRSPHFIGEVGTSLKAADLASEGIKIADEIKVDVQKRIKERIEAAQKGKLEGTATQLKAKTEKIKEDAKLSPEEKQKRSAELTKEITRLEAELKLFERQKALPDEIKEAEESRNEARGAVTERESELRTGRNDQSIDLIKWSGDMSEPESWLSLKALSESYRVEMSTIVQRINDLKEELKDHNTGRPPGELRKITQTDPSTGFIITQEPEAVDIKEKEGWVTRRDELQSLINEKRAKIDTVNWADGTKTLAELATETEKEYLRRKAIVEDDLATKQIISDYRQAVKTVKDKTSEETKVKGQISALNKQESDVANELKKANEKKDIVENDKLDANDQREVEVLEGLATLFTGDAKQAMEQRIQEKSETVAAGASLLLEWGPEFDGYPKALLETVRLMFGEEVISAYPPAEKLNLVKQTLALLSSGQYVEIIIDELEDAGGVVGNAKVEKLVSAGATKNVEINKGDLQTKTKSKGIETMDITKINKEVIENILKRIRTYALGVKS